MIGTLGLVLVLLFSCLFLLMWGVAAYYLIKHEAKSWTRVLLLLLVLVAVLSSYFLLYYFLVLKYESYGLSYLLLLIVPFLVFLRIVRIVRSRKKSRE